MRSRPLLRSIVVAAVMPAAAMGCTFHPQQPVSLRHHPPHLRPRKTGFHPTENGVRATRSRRRSPQTVN